MATKVISMATEVIWILLVWWLLSQCVDVTASPKPDAITALSDSGSDDLGQGPHYIIAEHQRQQSGAEKKLPADGQKRAFQHLSDSSDDSDDRRDNLTTAQHLCNLIRTLF
jgi:hypothetical protein